MLYDKIYMGHSQVSTALKNRNICLVRSFSDYAKIKHDGI